MEKEKILQDKNLKEEEEVKKSLLELYWIKKSIEHKRKQKNPLCPL
jgi:hypothetical protein